MYVFYIRGSEVKSFMNKLLKEQCFDDFDLRNAEIISFAKFDIDGKMGRDFINEEEGLFFCKWGRVRHFVFEFVKGKIKPSYMKFVISAPEKVTQKVSENASALFLNFVFENDTVMCTAGTAQKTFTLSKELDLAWEDYVKDFFKSINVAVERG